MTELTRETVLRRRDVIVFAEIGASTSLMDIEKGLYYGLEDVGARIWALLELPRPVRDVRDQLVQEFDIDAGACESELLSFLNALVDNGLLEVVTP